MADDDGFEVIGPEPPEHPSTSPAAVIDRNIDKARAKPGRWVRIYGYRRHTDMAAKLAEFQADHPDLEFRVDTAGRTPGIEARA